MDIRTQTKNERLLKLRETITKLAEAQKQAGQSSFDHKPWEIHAAQILSFAGYTGAEVGEMLRRPKSGSQIVKKARAIHAESCVQCRNYERSEPQISTHDSRTGSSVSLPNDSCASSVEKKGGAV